ncbi:MAG: type II toxin-antitoxin system RelE/ParE family toxin [Magnetococcales bacterium]|nr:type II toxin-antitoxin system RelE/ParE family toxin [Magnetococcales bacterium]
MRVVITNAAKADLVEIGEFIRPHNPTRAATFVDELLDRCAALADKPRAYALVPRYERHGIRRYAYRDYLIFYRIAEDLVEIIHIIHGARDYDSLLP